ncbi:MAG: DUF2860 family protein [Desulfobacterales bacterium]|jgi:hypothetical protein
MPKYQWVLYGLLLCLPACLPLTATRADEGGVPKAGWSFSLAAGAGYMVSNDQLQPNDGNKRVRDLDDNANRFDRVIPLASFDLRYTFAESGRQLYLGTPLGTDGPPGLTLGAVLPLDDGSQMDLGAFVKPFGEVWEDPYLVDSDRHETDKHTYGAQIDYTRIGGTGFEAGYTLSRIDIDDDEIGKRFDDLERDGWIHALQLGYAFKLTPGLTLLPQAGFTVGDLDGEANSYRGYRFKLGLRRLAPTHFFNLSAEIGYQDYDDEHPIFFKDREDVTYSIFGLYTRSNLFGHTPLFGTLLAGYRHRSVNIDFLEADTVISGIMLGYQF